MTLAVEPMVNQGDWRIKVMRDGWTVRTADGSLSAHYENSILITKVSLRSSPKWGICAYDVLRGDVVRSTAGHDKDGLFLVLQAEGDFLWLVDGKRRKLETPKKKRRKHVVSAGVWTHPVAGRLQNGEPVLDSDIRRALAAFRNRFSETKEE